MQRNDYLQFRRKFEPIVVKLAIVAESPPVSGKYFYNPDGRVTEPLFAALMQQLDVAPPSKEIGLEEFRRRGWLLVDATYEQVNVEGKDRDDIIGRDYPQLCEDLSAMLPDRSAPIILVKANVCRLLDPRLIQDGFNVINRGRVVPFPSNGRQPEFKREFGILKTEAARIGRA